MKRLIKALVILTIITILLLAILNSCTRLKSYEYQPVVSYESNNSEIKEMNNAVYEDNDDEINSIGSLLQYEQIILISSIILVIIFTFIFFNFAPKKK